jgi:hypothetical protein
MKINQHIAKLVCPSSSGCFLTDHCSGAFPSEIRRSVLLTAMLGVIVGLATGCFSTGTALNARLISPIKTNSQAANSDDDGSYQRAQSPAFSDLFGS